VNACIAGLIWEALMPQHFRQNYGLNTTGAYNFQWDVITHQSWVVITASEGGEPAENGQVLGSSASPIRFIGDARFTVHSVSPHDGGVSFFLEIDWPAPLNTWVDITVFDPGDPSGQQFL
jgi:hypothetical protein